MDTATQLPREPHHGITLTSMGKTQASMGAHGALSYFTLAKLVYMRPSADLPT